MATFSNSSYGVKEIQYHQNCKCYCPFGKAWYTNNFTVTIQPKNTDLMPDYLDIDSYINEMIKDGEHIIEEAASMLKGFLCANYHYVEEQVTVETSVYDAGHGNVTVIV